MSKKLGLLGMMLCAVGLVGAQTIDFILPSGPGGISFRVQQLLTPDLEKAVKVNTIIAGNCAKGHSMFEKTTDPTIMIAYNGFASAVECPLVANPKDLYVSLFTGPVAVCANPSFKDPVDAIIKRRVVSVGLGGGDWSQPVIANLNPSFKQVVYPSSGALLKGFAAGDTDFIVSSLIRATALMDAGKAVCLANTGKTTINNMPPASQVFPDWKYNNKLVTTFVVVGKNLTADQTAKIRQTIDSTMLTETVQAILNKDGLTQRKDISFNEFIESSKVWAIR